MNHCQHMGIIGGGKTVPEQLLVHDISGMFEMGTGRVLAEEFVGAAGKTIAESGAGAGSGSFGSYHTHGDPWQRKRLCYADNSKPTQY
jgi:hypothetical protein